MDKIEFRCINCGAKEEKEVLAIGHAIKSFGRKITDEADCCSDPYYKDSLGYCKVPRETGILQRISSIRA